MKLWSLHDCLPPGESILEYTYFDMKHDIWNKYLQAFGWEDLSVDELNLFKAVNYGRQIE